MATGATPSTYNSLTDLSLGNIPQVDDPQVYTALLDLHNAIETLLTSSDDADSVFAAYIAKRRGFKEVTSDYTVLPTDPALIKVDTTAGDVTITMHPVIDGVGYEYDIKQVAGAFSTIVVGDSAAEPVDSDPLGITLDLFESIPLKNDGIEWWIHN